MNNLRFVIVTCVSVFSFFAYGSDSTDDLILKLNIPRIQILGERLEGAVIKGRPGNSINLEKCAEPKLANIHGVKVNYRFTLGRRKLSKEEDLLESVIFQNGKQVRHSDIDRTQPYCSIELEPSQDMREREFPTLHLKGKRSLVKVTEMMSMGIYWSAYEIKSSFDINCLDYEHECIVHALAIICSTNQYPSLETIRQVFPKKEEEKNKEEQKKEPKKKK